MLQLKSIRLFQFKNYLREKFVFNSSLIGITGPNGAGKTNLLDAIYYLSFTRSYFNAREALNIAHGKDAFRIEGRFLKKEKNETVSCVYRGRKKEVSLNDKPYDRFSHHIGLFPAVFVAPDDGILITGGSEVRRKFMDVLLSQMDPKYLEHLIAYQKILSQRNSLLKRGEENRNLDTLLEVFDRQLVENGKPIFDSRCAFLSAFNKKVQRYYAFVSDEKEQITVAYDSALRQEDLRQLLLKSRKKDIILQRTTRGIHRDDLNLLMDGYPVRQAGSQGQKKSLLFALKLAQFELLREHNGFPPVLLLDDIFEKLDRQRIKRLIDLIKGPGFGQVFITDTEEERLKAIFGQEEAPLQIMALNPLNRTQISEENEYYS